MNNAFLVEQQQQAFDFFFVALVLFPEDMGQKGSGAGIRYLNVKLQQKTKS